MVRTLALTTVLLMTPTLAGCSSSTGGGPSPIQGTVSGPGQMVLDGDSLVLQSFDFNAQAGSLVRVSIDTWHVTTLAGGDPTFDVGGGHGGPLVADAKSFYFFASTQPDGGGGIFSLPRAGGSPTKLVDTREALGLAVDATRVYWVGREQPSDPSGIGSVQAVPIGGGAATILADGQVIGGDVAVDSSSVYWSVRSPDDPQLAGVVSMPLAGGTPATLATGQLQLTGLRVDGGFLYWMNVGTMGVDCTPTDGALVRLPVAGGTPTTLANHLAGLSAFTVAGGKVTFSMAGAFCNVSTTPTGSVAEVPVTSGTPTTLASGVLEPGAVVVGGSTVYWTALSDGGNVLGGIQETGD